MPNVVGYVRVSTRSQDYTTQVEAIKKYCNMNDEIKLVRIFEDKASGKNIDRPGYRDLVSMLEVNSINVNTVLVCKIDRIGRSLRDLLSFVELCKNKNVNFVSINDFIDTSTNVGKLFFNIVGALAEYERLLIIERTETGRRRYVENGGHLGKEKIDLPIDEIVRQKEKGIPITRIAKTFRVTRSTIYDRLKEYERKKNAE